MKSVSMLLFLSSLSTGIAYAESPKDKVEVDIVQQTSTCQGVVKDAIGESIIGASVIVKGTTNGTITDIEGNFSLPNVKKEILLKFHLLGILRKISNGPGRI